MTAKDLAFNREREKYKKTIKELNSLIRQKDIEIAAAKNQTLESETKCLELQDWIQQLLTYTELTEEDMKKLIKKEKDTAEVMERMNGLFGIVQGLY